jgi:hypothetical protein
MKDHQVKYYPAGNGDTTLITLSDDTSIIIDVNVTESAGNDSVISRYDIHADLLSSLSRDESEIPYTNSFILSHGDQDHVRGIDNVFYLGDPADYSDDDLEDGRIRINELWFTPRILNEKNRELCLDARAFRAEAIRRIKLYKEDKKAAAKKGNRIRIIGYSDNSELEGLEDIVTAPGNQINLIDGSIKDDFSFFIHAPHKIDTDENNERNDTSLVLQARFDVDNVKHAGKALFGGDAGWRIWALILKYCIDNNIEYDLFLAPHHCSWGYFSDVPYANNTSPATSSIEVLQKKRPGAYVISSSKEIEDNDDNPPHFPAKQEYIEVVGSDNFLVTSEHPSTKKPLPIIFRMTPNGPQKIDNEDTDAASRSGLFGVTVSKPKTYG